MMNHICLRTCYVGDRLWTGGEIYDLSEAMPKDPKNFKTVDGPPEGEATREVTVKVDKREDTDDENSYMCPKCNVRHRNGSRVYKRHLKHIK